MSNRIIFSLRWHLLSEEETNDVQVLLLTFEKLFNSLFPNKESDVDLIYPFFNTKFRVKKYSNNDKSSFLYYNPSSLAISFTSDSLSENKIRESLELFFNKLNDILQPDHYHVHLEFQYHYPLPKNHSDSEKLNFLNDKINISFRQGFFEDEDKLHLDNISFSYNLNEGRKINVLIKESNNNGFDIEYLFLSGLVRDTSIEGILSEVTKGKNELNIIIKKT